MLILRRKIGDSIRIGDNITIVVNRVSGRRVSLGVSAPSEVRVVRGELSEVASEGRQTAASKPLLGQEGCSEGKAVCVDSEPSTRSTGSQVSLE
ncbi:MAG: carbon storage regulator [Pirellulaceae bacterium]